MSFIVVDEQNYILDGTLYEVPVLKAPLNEESMERAVHRYKTKMVDKNIAFGALDLPIQENWTNDMPMEEFIPYSMQDPIEAAKQLEWDDGGDGEEMLSPVDAAFQIMDIAYDSDSRCILGRIFILDTPAGREVKKNIDDGMKCLITQASIDEAVDRDRSKSDRLVMAHLVRKIRGGWRMSFEKEENVDKLETI